MSSITKGLPGFLRRSLRTYDQEEEEEDIIDEQEEEEEDETVTTADRNYHDGSTAVKTSNDDDHDVGSSSSNDRNNNFVSSSSNNIGEKQQHHLDPTMKNKNKDGLSLTENEGDKIFTNDDNYNDDDVVVDESQNNQQNYTAPKKKVSIQGNNSTTSSSNSSSRSNNTNKIRPSMIKRQSSYKETQFHKAISAEVVNMSDLKKLAWNGCPSEHRAHAWKIMLGYVPVNSSRRKQTLSRKRKEYKDAIQQHYDIDDDIRTGQEQETLRQVLVDVPRTAPDVPLFRNDRIRRCLSRLLYIWAMRHPASSYVQGINDLATPLIVVFLSSYIINNGNHDNDSNSTYNNGDNSNAEEENNNSNTDTKDAIDILLDGKIMNDTNIITNEILDDVEADCYWCLTNLLAGIQDHYTSDQPGVQRMVLRLEELVNRIDADLCNHLRNVGIEFMQFAFKWMNCLLLREFTLKCICRLWDTYLSEGTNSAGMSAGFEDFHVYVCAAFLCQFSNQLQNMEFDEMFAFMQHIPTDTWNDTDIEMLLSQAFVLSTLFKNSDAHLTSPRTNSNEL